MKKIIRRFKEKLTFKDLPPPYRENGDPIAIGSVSIEADDSINNAVPCDALDLLANCKVLANADGQTSEAEYAEIQDMGIWHSTPLAHRHKSKVSLTWVLKENLDSARLPDKNLRDDNKALKSSEDRHRTKLKYNEVDCQRKCKSDRDRVVGRNEFYHNLRFRSACDEFVNGKDTDSDTSVGTEEHSRRKHRHRHRRKKRSNARFGYDIQNLDSFLSEASIDRPGNIPVVIAYPTTLYQTYKDCQRELSLPLGTVVNAVFKNQQWLYAQTPHGDEGYVMYSACLPLGILPNRTSTQKKTPCWESSTDIYPRPCGNLTDTEKEQLRGRTRSECRYKPRKQQQRCAEKDFDSLYLKTKSICSDIDKLGKENKLDSLYLETKLDIDKTNKENKLLTHYSYCKLRQTLLVVNSDYKGNALNKTVSVQAGDVVVLVQGGGRETDVDAEWFYVKKRDGTHGFIPAAIAGHGYI